MRRVNRCLLSGVLAGVLIFSPVSMVTVLAQGHHGGSGGQHCGQSTPNSVTYYYCGGHEAHHHENGVCPYAGEAAGAVGTDEPYYYCGDHEAHHHENGVCPYAGEAAGAVGTDEPYYYCGDHEAHHHENGVCPYAGEAGVSLAPTDIKVSDNGSETSEFLSAIDSREFGKRHRNDFVIKCKNICIGRIGY